MIKFTSILILLLIPGIKLFSQEISLKCNEYIIEGLDNDIIISAEKISCNQIVITTDNGKIYRSSDNDCKISLVPYHYGVANILIKQIKQKDTITITNKVLKIEQIFPTASINLVRDSGEITKDWLVMQSRIKVQLENFFVDWDFEVDSFKMKCIRENWVIIDSKFKGRFNDKFRSCVDMMQPGDRVIFYDIYAHVLNRTQKVNDIQLLIVKKQGTTSGKAP